MPRAPGSEKRKPGRKGNFHGQRLRFLESFLPDWEKARQNRIIGDFWTTVISAYWKKFDWRLPRDEDTSDDVPVDEDPPGDAPVGDNLSYLTEEELRQKAATIRLVETVCSSFCKICFAASDANLLLPF
jgi:hypothetical protein